MLVWNERDSRKEKEKRKNGLEKNYERGKKVVLLYLPARRRFLFFLWKLDYARKNVI